MKVDAQEATTHGNVEHLSSEKKQRGPQVTCTFQESGRGRLGVPIRQAEQIHPQ